MAQLAVLCKTLALPLQQPKTPLLPVKLKGHMTHAAASMLLNQVADRWRLPMTVSPH
jgi:hypothetical protein